METKKIRQKEPNECKSSTKGVQAFNKAERELITTALFRFRFSESLHVFEACEFIAS